VDHHRIHVFRFYRREPLEFLQVDVFHAYLLWGMPVLKEAEMLEGRVSMPQRGLTHIAPVRENMFRLLQVEALLNSRRNSAKRERYRRRLLEYAAAHVPELRREVRTRLSRFALPALGRLRAGAYPAFRWYMRLTRIDFLLRRVLSRPAEVARFILARRSDDRLRFDTRPCGAVVRVNACVQGARDATYAALDALVHANAIDEWLPRAGSSARFSGKERRVLEQGGLLLEFTRGAGHDIAVAEDAAIREVTAALLSFLIRRHSILCGSADFEPHAEAVPA
jgi:hypothetical protein